MNTFIERIIRAAKLDANLYEEVEVDKRAWAQAMLVVVLSSITAGIGSLSLEGWDGLFLVTIAALIGWLLWAYFTYLIGTLLLPEPQTQSEFGQLLRTIGFSSAPGLIRILGIIPSLNWIVFQIAYYWMIAAMVIAVRQALDYTSTLRAFFVCFIAFLSQVILFRLILVIF